MLHVPGKVQAEAKYIRKRDPENPAKLIKSELDLAPLFVAGALHACDLTDGAEKEMFIEAAAELDDGEAACLAIAKCRSWLLATDERPTERLAKKYGVTIITTPEIMKRWADCTRASKARLARALRNVQAFANYVPRKSLPLHGWWVTSISPPK